MLSSEHPACQACLVKKTCLIQNPTTLDGAYTWEFETCKHYTCGDGLEAAIKAVHSNQWEVILLDDGSTVEAARFGTPHKPTHLKPPERWCDPHGTIFVREGECIKPTGQKVRALLGRK